MRYSYRVMYRDPRTGNAGLSIMYSESELTAETARLKSRGYIVTEILRPVGKRPVYPPPRDLRASRIGARA